MSPNYSLEPPHCDFIVVHRVDGMVRFEEWSLKGRLKDAMMSVVDDMFDGKYDENLDKAEFALGFVSAIDVIANGKLRLTKARDRSGLTACIDKAYAATHGKAFKEAHDIPTIFTDACVRMNERSRSGGGR